MIGKCSCFNLHKMLFMNMNESAKVLGLETAYPVVNANKTLNFFYNDNQAFNYAYGTAGILSETGEAMVREITLQMLNS